VGTVRTSLAVVGLGYSALCPGLKGSYGIYFATGAKVLTAIDVQPAFGGSTETAEVPEPTVSARVDGLGVV